MIDYRKAVDRVAGESRFTARHVIRIGLIVIGIGVVFGGVGWTLGWFREGATVVQEEFGPRAMLKKYEWFKDSAAQLDKKRADISLFEQRMSTLGDRSTWDRTTREISALWQSELIGVQSSYNSLAAEYNAQMAKFNWRFAEAGRLPAGAVEPLPREFKPYTYGGE